MSRRLLLLLLFIVGYLFTFNAFGQINVEMYVFDHCKDSVMPVKFSLEDGQNFFSSSDSSCIVPVPVAGKYLLSSTYFYNGYLTILDRIVTIESVKAFKDTIDIGEVYRCSDRIVQPEFTGFCSCRKKCNGYYKGFFEGDSLIIEGYFKNGIPIKEIKYFNANNDLVGIEKYNKKGCLKRKIDLAERSE